MNRSRSVDAVRGLVMVVMALDHIRDYLGNAHFEATDLAQTTAPLFFSRWITHFCAPAFFLLAGVSAYLSIASGRRSIGQAARFLAFRGIGLVIFEQTLLRCFGWYFHFDYHFMNAGVLYGLGGSMFLLAFFLYLPPAVSLGVGLAIILGEAGLAALHVGPTLALFLQSRDFEPVAGYHFFVSYPPIPWFGVMAFGYGLAAFVYREDGVRKRLLVGIGLAFLVAFAAVRGANVLDAEPWAAQRDGFFLLSFLNVSKYPPSTPFLLMTLGVALLALAAIRSAPVLEVFGRVPLFYYIVHIPLIHLLAVIYSWCEYGSAAWLTSGPVIFWDVALPGSPPSYGLSLGWIYAVWLAVNAALYPLCRWYRARW